MLSYSVRNYSWSIYQEFNKIDPTVKRPKFDTLFMTTTIFLRKDESYYEHVVKR